MRDKRIFTQTVIYGRPVTAVPQEEKKHVKKFNFIAFLLLQRP